MSTWVDPSALFAERDGERETRRAPEPIKAHDRRLRRLDAYALSPSEVASYWSGEWKTPRWLRKAAASDRECAAELAARIGLMLGEDLQELERSAR